MFVSWLAVAACAAPRPAVERPPFIEPLRPSREPFRANPRWCLILGNDCAIQPVPA